MLLKLFRVYFERIKIGIVYPEGEKNFHVTPLYMDEILFFVCLYLCP